MPLTHHTPLPNKGKSENSHPMPHYCNKSSLLYHNMVCHLQLSCFEGKQKSIWPKAEIENSIPKHNNM